MIDFNGVSDPSHILLHIVAYNFLNVIQLI